MSKDNKTLADKIIEANSVLPNHQVSYWGIDDTGAPMPNPVNVPAVVMRVLSYDALQHRVPMFRIGQDIFVDRKRVLQTRNTLMRLVGRAKIVSSPTPVDDARFWKQMKDIINQEHPLIWERLLECLPEYSKDYIRIKDDLIWGVEEGDILNDSRG